MNRTHLAAIGICMLAMAVVGYVGGRLDGALFDVPNSGHAAAQDASTRYGDGVPGVPELTAENWRDTYMPLIHYGAICGHMRGSVPLSSFAGQLLAWLAFVGIALYGFNRKVGRVSAGSGGDET